MNYAGKFGSGGLDSLSSTHVIDIDSLSHRGDAITIPDAHLLFSGDFHRSGSDLIISDDLHRVVVPRYFHGDRRPTLVSPEGAPLDPSVIEALTGHTAYAQAGNPPAPKVVGHVAKMTGSASIVRNGVTIDVQTGDAVYQTDVVQTGSRSSLGLVLDDGTTFNLSANARLMLNDLTFDASSTSNSSFITLVEGAANFVAGQIARTGDMKVATPVAVIGIRGTAVKLEISAADGKVDVSVIDQRDGQVHSVQVFKCVPTGVRDPQTGATCSAGDAIATVSSNGPSLSVTPTTGADVTVQAINKTPAQVAQEFNAFQATIDTYNIQKQINPNLPQHTENGTNNANPQQTRYATLGSTPPDPPPTDPRAESTDRALQILIADVVPSPDLAVTSLGAIATATTSTVNATSLPVSLPPSTTAPQITAKLTFSAGTSSSDNITSNDALSGTGVANTAVYFTIDGTPIASTVMTDANGAWSFTPSGLADGVHTIVASQTDTLGYTGTVSLSFTLDTTAPSGGPPSPVVAFSNTDNITAATAPTFTVALSPSVAVGDKVQLLLDGSPLAHAVTHVITSADVTAGSVELAVTSGDLGADGSKQVMAQFSDAAGNSSTTAALSFTLDTTAPVIAITSAGGPIDQAAQTIAGVVDATEAGGTVTILDGATALGTAIVQNDGSWSTSVTLSGNGSHSIVAKDTDTAGNTGTSTPVVFTLSTTGPTVTESLAFDTGASASDNITSNDALTGTGLANTAVDFTIDGSLIATTVTTDALGAWSFTPTGLADGAHTIVASQTDAFSNIGTAALSFTLDTAAPAVVITTIEGGDNIINAAEAAGGIQVSGTAEIGSTLTVNGSAVAVDGTGHWTASVTPAGQGALVVTAVATDAAGNSSTTSTTLTVDTLAPAVVITTIEGGNNIINEAEAAGGIQVSGTAEIGSTLTVNGSAVAVDGAGLWTTSVTPAGQGALVVTAVATDAAGNSSTTSTTLTVDTVAPAVGVTTIEGGDNIINAAEAAGGIQVSGTAEIGSTLTVNGSAVAVDGTGHWTASVTPAGQGALVVTAVATDAAGNSSTTSTTLTVDTTAPAVAITSAGGSVNQAAQTISGTGEAGTTVTLFDNGSTTASGTALVQNDGSWSTSVTLSGNGSHSIVAKDTDTAGNTGTSTPVVFTLSTTGPTVTESLAFDTGASASDNITSNDALTGTGLANTAVDFTIDGSLIATTVTTDALGAWSFTPTGLADGAHTIVASQTDAFSNIGTAALSFTLDTTVAAPSAPDMTVATDTGSSSTDNLTSNTTPTFTGSGAEAGATVTLFDTNGTTVLGTVTADGSGNWSITSTTLSAGNHTLTAKQTDIAGNISVASAGLAITIDTAAPAVAITSAGGSVNQAAQTISGTGEAGTTVMLFDNGSATASGTAIVQNDGSWSTSVTLSGNGSHSIVAKDTDTAGNTGTSTAVVYTLSTTGPAVTESLTFDTGASASDNITSNDALTGTGLANTTVDFTIDGSLIATTVTTDVLGAWSFTPTGLADGAHTIVASQTDAFSNIGTAALSFTLDTTVAAPSAPDMTVATDTGSSSTDNLTSNTTPTFTGSGAEAGATVTLFDTNGTTVLGTVTADGSGNWSITSTTLSAGNHTLTAKQTDIAGNISAASAGLAVTIDTTAAAPSAPDMTVATDTGSSSTDNLTSNTTPTFTGSGAEAGATVTLFDTNGTTVLGTATADGSGNWSITSTTLSAGNHTLTAKQTDIAGNISVASAGLAVTIDTTAAAPSAPDMTVATDTGSSSTDNLTSNTTPTFTGSGAEAGATVTLFDTNGTTVLGTATADGSGNWSITSTTLSAGNHTLTAKQTDIAGNISAASAGLAVTIDTTAAAPSAPDMTVATDTGSSSTDNLTSNTTPTFTGSGAEAGATVTLFDTNGTTVLGTATADGSGNWSITSTTLSAGNHTLTAKQTDIAGNISVASAGLAVTIDTTAAAPSAPDMTVATDTGSSSTDNLTSNTTPTFTGSGAEAGATVTLFDTNGTTVLGTVTADGSGNWSITSTTLSAGNHTLTAKQTDIAGNISVASAGLAVTIDTTAAAPSAPDMTVATDTGSSSTDNLTSNTTPTFTGSGAEAGATVTLFDTNGTTVLGTATADGSGNWSITSTTLSAGNHTLTAKQTDIAGNISAASAGLAVTIDTTAAAPSAPDMTVATDTGSSSTDNLTSNTTPTFTGSGAEAGATVTLFDTNGTTVLGTATADGSGNWSITSTTLSAGNHTLTAKQTDIAGNISVASAGLAVTIDTTAAAPSAPDMTVATDTGSSSTDNLTSNTTPTFTGSGAEAGATVTLFDTNGTTVLGTATADGSGNWSITSTTLSAGNHTLTAKQTDIAGNISVASAGLAITIDTAAPAVAITSAGGSVNQAAQTISGTGEAGTTVTLFDNGSTTASGTALVQNDGSWSTSVTLSGNGSHSIVAKDTDTAGNTGTSTPVVFTLSTTGPTVTESLAFDTGASASDNITSNDALTGTGLANTTVDFTIDGSLIATTVTTDVLGAWSFTPTGLADGAHTIVASQTDAFSNIGTAALSFTLDTTVAAPSAPDMTVATDTGSSSTDNLTSNTTPTFTGSGAEAGATVTLFDTNGTTVLGTATADGSGNWSITSTTLSAGNHTLTAKQTDIAGNISAASAGLAVTIDTTAAAPSAPDMTVATDTGSSSTDNLTSNTTPTFTGSGAEAGATVTLFDTNGTTVLGTATADGSGNWSITSTTLSAGNHTLTAKQTDIAGNISVASAGLAVTIDTTAAAPSAPDMTVATDTGSSSTDNLTSNTTPTFTGSGAEAGATVTLFDTNGTTVLGTATADGSGNWSITSTTLSAGNHTLTAKQTDIAGNISAASAGLAVTIDTTAAAPSAPDMTVATDTGSSSTDNLTSNTTPTFTGSGAEAGATVTLFDTNGTTVLGTATADGSGNWSITSTTLSAGNHTLTAKQTDIAGNISVASAGLAVTIDTTAAAPSAPDMTVATDTGSSSTDNLTSNTTPTFTGSGAEAGATVTLFDTNGTTVLGTATADGSGNWSITSTTLSAGNHTLTAKQTDIAGNISVASAGLAVTIDTTAPTAPSTPDLVAASDSGNTTDNNTNIAAATFAGTAEAGSTVTIFSDGVAVGSGVAIGGNYSITTSALADGPHSITAKATDTAGNTSAASAALSVVIDTAAPAETLAITSVADSTSPTDQTITVSGSNSALAPGDKIQISADAAGLIWTDVVQNTATRWSFADSVPRTANFIYRTRIVDIAANVGAIATQAVLVANNGATISAGASSGLVAKFTGTAGGTLQLGPSPITGTVNAISIASGLIVISGDASVTSGTGDAIDLNATGGTQAAPANLSIDLTGLITGAASGIVAVQNAYGSITVTTDGPVIGQAGRGILAQQSATGVGSILVEGSGNVTGTGSAFNGLIAQNLNTANNNDVTVTQSGNVSGGRSGIRAQTNGDGNVTVTTGAGATITGISLYGIEAFSNGQGNISVTTASGDFVFSGSVGINVYNQATSILQTANSTIAVTANGTINSGTTYTGGGGRPAGILAGYKGGTTNTANSTAFGTVTVDNFATINAAGGDGIRAYNYGPGNVTVNDHAGTIVAQDMSGISASTNGTGNVSVSTDVGITIKSGSSGIQAVNNATAVPLGTSTVSVTARGIINSGTHLTPGGNQPQGVSAGYFASNGVSNTNVNGTVILDNFADVTAAAGWGLDAYNYGNGSVTLIDEAGTNVSGAQYGIAAYSNSSGAGSSGSVTINVGANAKITARALYGIAAIQGNINNSGNVSITTGAGDIINSGGTGINSNSIATSAASSQISITTLGGTINSGYNFFQGGGTPSGISAGYGTNGALSTALQGNVILDNSATINAVSGAGINLYNNGLGSISATLRAGLIKAAQGGVNAFSKGGGYITIDNRGTINAGSIGINTGNGTSNPSSANGLISVINSGAVNAPGAPYIAVVTINNSNSSQTATLSNSPGGTVAAGLFGRTTSNVAVSIFGGNGAITNSGTITGNVAFFANGNFTNAIGGIWNLNGNSGFGTGATAISNAGTMSVSGWVFLSAANNGPVALSNTNAINVVQNSVATIFANVSGVGTISIGDRSALEISGSVAASQGFNILGKGLLTFDNPAFVGPNLSLNFTGSATGNLGTIISLINGGISAANIAGAMLTVTGAFQSYSFQLSGTGLSGNYFDVLSSDRIILVPTTATIISNVTTSQSPATPVNFYILDNDHINSSTGPGFNLATNDGVPTNTYTIVANASSGVVINGAFPGLRVATQGASGAIINAANISGPTPGTGPNTGIAVDTTLSGNNFNGSADIVNYGNVSGVTNAIVANTVNGNVNIVSGFTSLTGTNSFGIFGRASGSGGINIMMSSGGTINAGLIGIAAFEAQMPTGGAGGNVTVYNSSNITSGTNTANLANSGAAGIRAGILNNNTSVPNAAITGDVTIENRANITAQAGAGLFAFNYGSGNTSVTFAPGPYSITAVNGGATGTGTGLTQYGIFAFNYGTGSSLVNAGWGTTITSGSTGINAGNQATAIAPGSGSTVSVYSQGFVSSGTNVNNGGSAPSAIQAGYNPGGNGSFSKDVYGDVIVNVASDDNLFGKLLAAAGPGILAYDYGVGNIAVTVGQGVSIQALTAATSFAPYGIATINRGPGNIVVTTSGGLGSSINSGSTGINAVNDANPTAGSDLANLFAANVAAGKPAVIAVTAAGTINSGSQPTNSGGTPSGIAAGFFGSGGVANQYVSGNVFINNAAVVTAAGHGLQGYNFGYGNVTVNDAAGANITAGFNGIYAHADGGFTDPITASALARDIAVNVYANTIITAGTASSTANGILALSTNAGSISVITTAGATIDSHQGASGISAVNEAPSIASSFNSSVVVTNAATIHSGAGLTGFGNQPAGINTGYIGGTTNPAPGNLANYNVIGEVVVNNFGNITADAGNGIIAYSYGVGNVTANDVGGHITALGGASPPNGSGIGILAQNFGPGNVRVTTSAGTTITSGGSGIAAVNKAISADPANPSVVVPLTSEVSVLAFGTIQSGTIPTATVANDPAAGILAGYNPNNTNTPNNNVHGNVSIDDYATILAPAGTDGIRGVNYGTGNITIVVEAGAGITGGRYGVAALGYDGGNVSITNSGLITGSTDAVNATTTSSGTAVIDNFGHLVGNATGYNATFTNEIGGDWSLNGSSVFTGTSTLVNAGLVDSNGVSAISGLSGITNTGTIEVQSGSLTLGGPMTGAGTVLIYGATMEFGGASDANVQFTSNLSGTLVLDDASHFTGTVTGFGFGDAIHLVGIAPVNVSVTNSGSLHVGYETGSFNLIGNYDPAGFLIASDGGTGTNITWNHQAPVLVTNNLTTVFNADLTTTVLGVQVTDSDVAAALNLTATTGAAALGTSITPSSSSGSLAAINSVFTSGVTYHPGGTPPATDKVTLTVTDSFGASDTVNFVFNQAGSGPNITLQGTSGKDVVFATSSQDVLTGGAGQDQFLFAPTSSGPTVQHTVTDFEAGIDKLDVRQFSGFSAASVPGALVQQGSDTLITLDAHDTLLLKNVFAASVHASDFIVHA